MHFQFDLADDPRFLNHTDHLVVFRHIERRNLHGEDMDTAAGALLHLFQMTVVRRSENNRFNIRMFFKHLRHAQIAGHAVVIQIVNIFGALIFRAGRHPVEFGVFAERLIIFPGVTVRQGCHGYFYGFHASSS